MYDKETVTTIFLVALVVFVVGAFLFFVIKDSREAQIREIEGYNECIKKTDNDYQWCLETFFGIDLELKK
ncbi:hypothetical protein IH981_04260 [Patescibacteria group bacterium]|nr:hypothetical protein [Patescibacteria group bacterium]